MRKRQTLVFSVVSYCLMIVSAFLYIHNTIDLSHFYFSSNENSEPSIILFIFLFGLGAFINLVFLMGYGTKMRDISVNTTGGFIFYEWVRYPNGVFDAFSLLIATFLRATAKIVMLCFGAIFNINAAVGVMVFCLIMWFTFGRSNFFLWEVISFSCWFVVSYFVLLNWLTAYTASTPYDIKEPFNLFISYRRTLYAERVRHIAEILISQGVRVWFDDYAMFATNLQKDVDISSSIRTGIENSARAIIFESDDYNESQWCRDERSYLEKTPGKILIHRPQIAESERTESEMILKELQLQPPLAKIPRIHDDFAGVPNFFRDERAGYQFDARGWAVAIQGGFFSTTDEYKGPALIYRRGIYRLGLNVDIGPSVTCPDDLLSSYRRQDNKYVIMQRAFDDLFKGSPDSRISEKKLWDIGYNFARSYAAARGVVVCGSHVLVLGKEYHYAVTYWDKRGWVRRYSIVATDPVTRVRLELAIGFKFFGPFLEFCSRAYQMDALVQSFRCLSDY